MAHTRCLCIQQESSGSQVHDYRARPKCNDNQCPGLLLGSSNLVTLPSSPHSPRTGEGSRAVDQVDSDLSRVGRINVVASVG